MRRLVAGIALVGGLVAAPVAQANVISADGQGVVIRLAAETTARPLDAWKTLIAPAQWWSKEHTFSGDAANLYLDSQATGCFCEKLPLPKDAPEGLRPGSAEHMHIVLANPGQVLRMTGGIGPLQGEAVRGTLTILLRPTANGTRFVWEYVISGYMRRKPEDMAALMDGVLGEQLASLVRLLGPVQTAAVPPKAVPAAAAPPMSNASARPDAATQAEVAPAEGGGPALPPASPLPPAVEPVPIASPSEAADGAQADTGTAATSPVAPSGKAEAAAPLAGDEGVKSVPPPPSKVKVWMKTGKGAAEQVKSASAAEAPPPAAAAPAPDPVIEGR